MKTRLIVFLAGLALVGAGCTKTAPPASNEQANQTAPPITTAAMTITSPAFSAGGLIPVKYSCDGENINPPLLFNDIPERATSLVLLMDDPDVPKNLKPDGVFDHWVMYNIPSGNAQVKEGTAPPGIQGKNGAGATKYTGPCPPGKEHRYFFKLYALDTDLAFNEAPTKALVEQAMQGHIVGQAELMGRYNRQQNK
jgi:Raf kinase inhibitor-like YbhB/YbcL family protein